MRARSYHASPGEITSVGGCAQNLSDELCKYTGWRCGASGDARGDPGGATPGYQDRYRWLAGLREHPEGIAPVPAPDSYPHKTCGWPVTGRRPPGVVAAVAPAAPRARHGFDHNTGTLAASAPAPSSWHAAGLASGRDAWAGHCGVAFAWPVLVPVVSVLFPEPGRGLDCPGAGPGKAVRAVR